MTSGTIKRDCEWVDRALSKSWNKNNSNNNDDKENYDDNEDRKRVSTFNFEFLIYRNTQRASKMVNI